MNVHEHMLVVLFCDGFKDLGESQRAYSIPYALMLKDLGADRFYETTEAQMCNIVGISKFYK